MTDAPTPVSAKPDKAHKVPKGLLTKLKHHILHPELTSEQIAWSFAIGLAVAFNPLLGLHTAMVLVFCAVFRGLHRPLMLIAAFLNNPWTMVPIATASAYFGNFIRGRGFHLNLSGIQWHDITWRSFLTWPGFLEMHEMLRPVLRSYLFGGTALSVLVIPVGYWAMLLLARRMRQFHFHHIHGDPHGHAILDETGSANADQASGSPDDAPR